MIEATIGDLVGKTPLEILGGVGDREVTLRCSDGSRFRFFNYEEDTGNDCSIWLEDLGGGDLQDLVGHEILVAEANSKEGERDEDGSKTWTFVTIRSHGGQVVMRWCGRSNGYYSEAPTFEKVES